MQNHSCCILGSSFTALDDCDYFKWTGCCFFVCFFKGFFFSICYSRMTSGSASLYPTMAQHCNVVWPHKFILKAVINEIYLWFRCHYAVGRAIFMNTVKFFYLCMQYIQHMCVVCKPTGGSHWKQTINQSSQHVKHTIVLMCETAVLAWYVKIHLQIQKKKPIQSIFQW